VLSKKPFPALWHCLALLQIIKALLTQVFGCITITAKPHVRFWLCLLVWCLRNNYTFAAMDFGRRLGASDEHIPKWICKERATMPPPKGHAALRVALKLAWGFVAQSVEYRWGYTPSLAPRPRPI